MEPDASSVEIYFGFAPGSFKDNADLLEDIASATPAMNVNPVLGAGGGLDPNFYASMVTVFVHGTTLGVSGFLARIGELAAENLFGSGNRKTFEAYESWLDIDESQNNGLTPLGYSCAGIRFHVHRMMSDEEQSEAFLEAAAFLRSDDRPSIQEGQEMHVFWDGASKEWREGPPVV